MMRFYTIGYGGRTPSDFLALLAEHEIKTVADVRIRPQRASMGSYVLAKTPDKGIQRLLSSKGIGYAWIEALGNPFKDDADWKSKYQELMATEGDARIKLLLELTEPFCLMCSEKKVEECHRLQVAEHLISCGHRMLGHIT